MSTVDVQQTAEGEFFVVGIGASAGGVDALDRLFRAMPDDIEAALVVITHLGPHRETLLAEIIGRATKLPVANATHGTRVQRGHVYVLPAEHVLILNGA